MLFILLEIMPNKPICQSFFNCRLLYLAVVSMEFHLGFSQTSSLYPISASLFKAKTKGVTLFFLSDEADGNLVRLRRIALDKLIRYKLYCQKIK
jgi:hypothetical protein